jgi:hypothetical protein
MFQFGLFATHLPYLILAGLYFIGFGLYSGKSVVDKIFLNINADKEIVYPETGASVLYSDTSKTIHFFRLNKEKQPVQASIAKQSSNHYVSLMHYIVTFASAYIFDSFYFTYFSRPPPIIL